MQHTQATSMPAKSGLGVAAILGIVALGLIAVIGFIAVIAISAYNEGNRFEQTIKATFGNNENILAQYGQKVLEASQVTEMNRDDILKTTRAAIEGRYGAEGSKAIFQAINESNPTVDPMLYRKLQQIIEAGRDEFKNNQTRLIDVKRSYETALGSFPKGAIMRFVGYPRIDLDKYRFITTDAAAGAFQSGKESGPIKLR